jgi:acetyl esterase/lipase
MTAPVPIALSMLLVCLLFTETPMAAQEAVPEPIPLWPGVAPGDDGKLGPEHDSTKHEPNAKPRTEVVRLADVSKPTITVYRPEAAKANGAAVVVCPGGGYHILAWDLEGTEICEWLNSIGVTGVLLKYRVPGRGARQYTAPLQDAQRAMGLVRQHARAWEIDPKRIGILGFSAGGHLAAAASNNFETRTYPAVDEADKESCRPDFTVLIYPAYLVVKETPSKLAPEINVTATTPPAFLVMTQDDQIGIENVFTYSLALKGAKVPVEAHIYPKGGHGYGLRPSANAVCTWPQRAAEWMAAQGLLKAK